MKTRRKGETIKFKRTAQIISLAIVLSFSATSWADHIVSRTFEMVIFENADSADTTGLLFTVEPSSRFRASSTSHRG